MSGAYDAIIVGGGHNGLTTAAYLAKRGRRVVVLEARDVLGGVAASEEFHPGYRTGGVLHDTSGVRPHVVRELELERHGLGLTASRPDVHFFDGNGTALRLPGDTAEAAKCIGALSSRDAEQYASYRGTIDRLGEVLTGFLDESPVDVTDIESHGGWEILKRGIRVRRLGKDDMMELLRLPSMCVADWLGEWFETDVLKAGLSVPAVAGSYLGPWSPGSNANLLLYEAAAGRAVAGDGPALTAALERCLADAGGEIRTGTAVERILTEAGAAVGARLAGGEELRASVIAASCHPRRVFLDLLPPGSFGYRLQHRIERYRSRGTTTHVAFALSAPPVWRGADGRVGFARIVDDVDGLERAFDAVKYRALPDRPALEVHVPTALNDGFAPPGHAVVSALVHFTPYDLEPGWDDAQRERIAGRAAQLLESAAPGFLSSVVATRVLTPVDLESQLGLVGGSVLQGEHSLDQRLVRPVPECVGGRSPIPGLYLCGSGVHPGGGLTCAPGATAAATILAAG